MDPGEEAEESKYSKQLLELLKKEGGGTSLFEAYSQPFEDHYGDHYEWQGDTATQHYLCRLLDAHYNHQVTVITISQGIHHRYLHVYTCVGAREAVAGLGGVSFTVQALEEQQRTSATHWRQTEGVIYLHVHCTLHQLNFFSVEAASSKGSASGASRTCLVKVVL